VRQVAHSLHPAVLEHEGLAAALEALAGELAESTGVAVETDLDPAATVSPAARVHVYRIVQEALATVTRHAGAKRVRVSLARTQGDGGFVVEVEDDGRGFGDAAPMGLGLRGARERAAQIGARLETGSAPLGGARVTLTTEAELHGGGRSNRA
jgi:two-component system sensor histidine kinase UhpB